MRHWYGKDKMILVDLRRVPELGGEGLEAYPNGYI